MPASMQKTVQTFDPPELSVPPAYSHVSAVEGPARLVFTAGQVGADKSGTVPESYEEQIKQALLNLTACLKGFGASPSDIVKLTYYIVNYDPKNRVHAPLLAQYLGSHRPSTTLVPVSGLAQPSFLFEIEATAAVPSSSPAPTLSKSTSTVPVADVIVIGAGLSGLQAAHDIQKAGLSCLVLEARDRVGGKTWSLPCANGKGVVDVGAAWINDTNQSKMFALAQRFGLETITQRTEGDCLTQGVGKFPYGSIPPFQNSDQENIVKIRDTIEDLCQMIDLRNPTLSNYDSMNLEEFVKHLGSGELAFQTARVWTKAMLGCEPCEMSALFFLDYCKSGGGLMQTRSDMKNGGQYLRIKKGTQSFSKGLAAALTPGSIHLNTPVSQIKQDTQGCTVISKTGKVFHSKKVILSVPTPLYKDITFFPSLTGAKLSLTNSTTLGCTSKMILVYEKPWWRTQNLSGMTQSFVGPYTITRDTSNDSEGHYSLTSMPGADAARAWSKLPAHERRAQILAQVAETFGNKEDAYRPVEIFEMEWSKEEFSKGCPCPVMPPNVLTKWGHALRERAGHLHFVGTETAFEWKGYMEGAVRSGERGAEEVVEVLRAERESRAKL